MTTLPTMECAAYSDRGRKRPVNEDQYLLAELNRSLLVEQSTLPVDDRTRIIGDTTTKLLVVADGMGGHVHGDRASSLAVRAITKAALQTAHCLFAPRAGESDTTLRQQLHHALMSCQTAVDADAEHTPEHRNMGTTLTMGCVLWPHLYVVHAGDSRCYLLRDAKLQQLTRDHTAAQALLDKGVLEADDVENTPYDHIVSNAIVARDDGEAVAPEVRRTNLHTDDQILLCTDGLTTHVDDSKIENVLVSAPSATHACETLVLLANELGGSDNVTVALCRINN